MKSIIEVSAYSVQWAIDAQKAGAGRVELCDNIYEGGTTPSYASVKSSVLCRISRR
jgi:copper homeostasis protein